MAFFMNHKFEFEILPRSKANKTMLNIIFFEDCFEKRRTVQQLLLLLELLRLYSSDFIIFLNHKFAVHFF